MAFNFSTLVPGLSALKTKPIAQPIGIYKPTRQQPVALPVVINWTQYNNAGAIANAGVSVDMSSGAAGTPYVLDHIASVSIDNTFSNVPIYVYFPDTGFTVVCAPDSTVQSHVVSNGLAAYIFGLGFTGGVQPYTTITFYNTVIPNAIGQESTYVQPQNLASVYSGNPVTNQTPYRNLALGDRVMNQQINAQTTVSGATVTPLMVTSSGVSLINDSVHTPPSLSFQFSPNNAGAYVYITGFDISMSYSIIWASAVGGGAVQTTGNIYFQDTSGAFLYRARFTTNLNMQTTSQWVVDNSYQLIAKENLQVKLPANQNFTFGVDACLHYDGTYTVTGGPYGTITQKSNGVLTLNVNYTVRDESNLSQL